MSIVAQALSFYGVVLITEGQFADFLRFRRLERLEAVRDLLEPL